MNTLVENSCGEETFLKYKYDWIHFDLVLVLVMGSFVIQSRSSPFFRISCCCLSLH